MLARILFLLSATMSDQAQGKVYLSHTFTHLPTPSVV